MTNGEKKGLHPLAWVAIGCGAIVVVGGILFAIGAGFLINKAKDVVDEFEANPAKAAAETIVRINPQLDLISSDEEAGTITFRNKETDETVTLDYEDIKEGKFSVTTDEGEYRIDASETREGGQITFSTPEGESVFGTDVDLSKLPDWVPRYPRTSQRQGNFYTDTAQSLSGAFSITTSDHPETVMTYYHDLLEGQGYEVTKQSFSSDDSVRGGNIVAINADRSRNFNITVQATDGGSQATINWGEKRE